MPNRMQWDPSYSVGDQALDDQHRNILARCDALADCVADTGAEGDREFQHIFDELMALAREHFATEEAHLAARGHPLLDELKHEGEEYEYLAAEIVTTENFDRLELQRFLSLWWIGHIVEAANRHRAHFEK